MTRAQQVLGRIDTIERMVLDAPVMAARVRRAGGSGEDLIDAYMGFLDGRGTRYGATLDRPPVARAAKRRHEANKHARRSRRANRR